LRDLGGPNRVALKSMWMARRMACRCGMLDGGGARFERARRLSQPDRTD
jgi:hypothetical protein